MSFYFSFCLKGILHSITYSNIGRYSKKKIKKKWFRNGFTFTINKFWNSGNLFEEKLKHCFLKMAFRKKIIIIRYLNLQNFFSNKLNETQKLLFIFIGSLHSFQAIFHLKKYKL
jgi:hypothetical protein